MYLNFRSAEILYSMMWAEMEYVGSDFPEMAEVLMENLVQGRQNLALFQHHDGVTGILQKTFLKLNWVIILHRNNMNINFGSGTAKDHVVVDYAERMQDSIQKLQEVMSHSTHYLLTSSKSYYKPSLQKSSFDLDDFRQTYDSLPKQSNINIESPDEPSRYYYV